MKSIYIGTLQIHSNTANLGYAVSPGISGMEFPEVRNVHYNKPGEHGAFLSNQLYGGRIVMLEGFVFATTVAAFEALRRQLADACRITRDNNTVPVAKTLKFTTMDDIALQADCYVRKFTMKVVNLLYAKFQIDIFIPDFAFQAQTEQSTTITRASGGGAVYPFIYPQIYGGSTGGQAIIVNAGNAEAFPTIYLNGPITNPIIQNTTVNRYIELSMTLNSTDQVVIDMKNKTIIKNGTTPVIANKTSPSQFWWLEKGSNTVKFFTSNGADTGNAQVKWRDSYLGI